MFHSENNDSATTNIWPVDVTYPFTGTTCVGDASATPTDAGDGAAAGFGVCFGLASVNK